MTSPIFSLPKLASLQAAAQLVHSVIPPTPQIRWLLLGQRVGAEVWVKHENHNPAGAFKVRGGIVYMEELVRQHPVVKSDVSATRGNHGSEHRVFGASQRLVMKLRMRRSDESFK